MKKKIVEILVCMLLIGTVLTVSGDVLIERISEPSFVGNTFYVGGNGPGNYTRIRDAIDNASDGDTVFVYNGHYFENITINVSINLIGEDKNSTIIDGYESGTVVTILVNNVTINGFTIQNSVNPLDFYMFCGVDIQSNNNNISNNIIGPKNYAGISCDWANNNTIQRNKFWYNNINLELRYSNNNNISYNFLGYSGSEAVHVWESNRNVIYHNDFHKNRFHVNVWEDYEHYPSNNTWIGNYWGRPRLYPKPILVRSTRGPFLLNWRIDYDMTPSNNPNGNLIIEEWTEENVFLWLWGRCDTEINAPSWDGVGLHIGKLQKCEIQINSSIFNRLSYRCVNLTEHSIGMGRISDGAIILENATGIFNKRQPLFALVNSLQSHKLLCFAKKMTHRFSYWWF